MKKKKTKILKSNQTKECPFSGFSQEQPIRREFFDLIWFFFPLLSPFFFFSLVWDYANPLSSWVYDNLVLFFLILIGNKSPIYKWQKCLRRIQVHEENGQVYGILKPKFKLAIFLFFILPLKSK